MGSRWATCVAAYGLIGSLAGYACSRSAGPAGLKGWEDAGGSGSISGGGDAQGMGGGGGSALPGSAGMGSASGSSGSGASSENELQVEPGVRLIVSGSGLSFVAFDQRVVQVDQADNARPFEGRYTKVDANSVGRPCALDTQGTAHCFEATGAKTTVPLGSGFTDIIAHDIAADTCLLNEAGEHLCWQFPGTINAVRGSRLVDTPIAPCVLTATGMLECSGTAYDSMPPLPAGPYISADIDGANLCGAKTSGGIECSTGEESPPYRTLIPSGEYVKVETFAGLICALTRAGTLSCWNSTCLNQPFCPPPFDGAPLPGRYRDITLNTLFPAAIREDGTVVRFVQSRVEETLYRAYTDGSPPRLGVPQRCEGLRVELDVEDVAAGRTELRATDLNINPGTVHLTDGELLDLRTGLQVSIHFEGEDGSLDEDVSCE
jgi:hypothetical protein